MNFLTKYEFLHTAKGCGGRKTAWCSLNRPHSLQTVDPSMIFSSQLERSKFNVLRIGICAVSTNLPRGYVYMNMCVCIRLDLGDLENQREYKEDPDDSSDRSPCPPPCLLARWIRRRAKWNGSRRIETWPRKRPTSRTSWLDHSMATCYWTRAGSVYTVTESAK